MGLVHILERCPRPSARAYSQILGGLVRNFHSDRVSVSIQEVALSLEYRPLYEDLLKRILLSPVMHIDETLVRLQDKKGYVWVMTTLDAVFFLYRPNREGGFLAEMLRPLSGVLVSDFYGVYDSLACPQQKCLVHFVRDIDDDLLKNPLDGELKTMAQEFSALLKQIIETVDRFGLKKRHLHKT